MKVSAPGRVCLFGEHQDYLNLPVIPSAISLRLSIVGERRHDSEINVHLPNIGERQSFPIQDEIPYVEERDYLRSAVVVLQRDSFTFSTGFDCVIQGSIPIKAGMGSSSALVVAWVDFLARMSDQAIKLDPAKVADYAYQAEVLEFSEPGGMMDQYSAALGGTFFLDPAPSPSIEALHPPLGSFVVGDSLEPKDTKFVLARVKNQVIAASETLVNEHPDFLLRNTSVSEIRNFASELTKDQLKLLEGTIRNYEITQTARQLLRQKQMSHREIGSLLKEQQAILRDILRISTLKIDQMIDSALEAGAFGAKINGSGGGGCMFAYAPENPQKVAKAIEKAGGRSYIVQTSIGTHAEELP